LGCPAFRPLHLKDAASGSQRMILMAPMGADTRFVRATVEVAR
jgi:hypothetical protein